MSTPAPRRFICRACGVAHATWAARCSKCHSLEGLAIASASASAPRSVQPEAVPEAPAPNQASSSVQIEIPSTSVLRLVPPPDPTLEPDELFDDQEPELMPTSVPVSLADVAEEDLPRDSTGLAPLDAVLGGGLVPGAFIALAGSAGCGKSTLTMQMLAGLDLRALLATGEESVQQAGARARRIGAAPRKVLIVAETDLDAVLVHARKTRAQVLMIDSIQTLVHASVNSAAGSPAQVRACTIRLMKFAKTTGTSVIVTCHMTSDDRIAGPSALKHFVDVVLELETGARFEGCERKLRCFGKNRYGPSNVVGHFELTGDGLIPVDADGWNEKL
jgi:predicted ATP-dependent serine protease